MGKTFEDHGRCFLSLRMQVDTKKKLSTEKVIGQSSKILSKKELIATETSFEHFYTYLLGQSIIMRADNSTLHELQKARWSDS